MPSRTTSSRKVWKQKCNAIALLRNKFKLTQPVAMQSYRLQCRSSDVPSPPTEWHTNIDVFKAHYTEEEKSIRRSLNAPPKKQPSVLTRVISLTACRQIGQQASHVRSPLIATLVTTHRDGKPLLPPNMSEGEYLDAPPDRQYWARERGAIFSQSFAHTAWVFNGFRIGKDFSIDVSGFKHALKFLTYEDVIVPYEIEVNDPVKSVITNSFERPVRVVSIQPIDTGVSLRKLPEGTKPGEASLNAIRTRYFSLPRESDTYLRFEVPCHDDPDVVTSTIPEDYYVRSLEVLLEEAGSRIDVRE